MPFPDDTLPSYENNPNNVDILDAYNKMGKSYVNPGPGTGTSAIPLNSSTSRIDRLTEKLQRVADASKEKIAKLDADRAALAGQTAQFDSLQAANAHSWVNGLGLNSTSKTSEAVNLAASAVSGLARDVGNMVSLIPGNAAADMEAGMSDAKVKAYNNFNQNKASAADIALLKSKDDSSVNEINPPTVMERFQQIERTRGYARRIQDTLDMHSIVNQDKRTGLDHSLEQAAPDLKVLTDSKASIKDRAKALAGVLGTAGKAAIDNPMAAAEYAAENLPQIAVGGLGKAGFMAMTGSNLGYAMDEYSKGQEISAKKGDLPSADERQKQLLKAGSLALAEQAGEMIQIGASGLFKAAEKTAAKAGFKGGFVNTLKAGAEGFAGEAATEGFQTAMENNIEHKDMDALSIYKGAVIGGLAGGGLTTGMHALSEISGHTPEKAAEQAKKVAQTIAFRDAVAKNDPSVFLNPDDKSYNPALAVGVLHQANLSEVSTPESRDSNFQKATEVLSSLDVRQSELKEQLKSDNPAEVKAARIGLDTLNSHVKDGQAIWNRMFDEIQKNTTPTSVNDQVQQANVPVQSATPEVVAQAQSATDSVINLSMASISHLTPQQAAYLATNTDNGLNDGQRSFLRAFSDARIAYNEAQSIGKVNNAVMNGDANNLGISQYRTRIGMSLTSGNQEKAQKDLAMLTTFATSHAEKAAAAQEAFDKYGDAGQVYKTANGWGVAAPGTYKADELRKGGGLPIVKPVLLKALNAEAKAVAATRDEMTQAVALKFGGQTKTATVQSAAPAVNSPPSPNLSTQENVEEEARPEVITSEPVAEAPLPPKKEKVNHEGKEFATAKEADQYVSDNYLGNSHELVRKSDKSGYTVEAKKKTAPKAEPKSVLAGEDKQAVVDAAIAKSVKNPNNGGIKRTDISETPVVPSPSPSPAASVADAPSLQDGEAALTENPKTLESELAIQQEAAEQPASASAVSAVAEAAPAVEAINEKAPAGATYQQKKLGDFFTQAATVLGKVKDFISLVTTPEQMAQHVGISGLTMEQGTALRSFMNHAKAWQSAITSNLVNRGKPEYNYEDAMQHFIRPDGDIEENVKTAMAYAVFSYVAENFGGKAFNTNDAINSILGRESGTFVNSNEREQFKDVTASMPAVIDALGQRIVASLGLKATKDTPVNELPRLQAGLGAHALRLLTDGDNPMMMMHTVSPQEMAAIRAGDKKVKEVGPTTTAEDLTFLVVNRDAERAPNETAADIVKSTQGSKGIVNELFSIEAAQRPPTFEPVMKLREYAKRTEQEVPSFLNKILKALNAQPNYLRQDKLEISQVLGDELFLKAMGVTAVDSNIHIANREPMEARNEGLRRELANIQSFIKDYLGQDLTTPFYFEHYAMKQQRVGITNSLVNPQLSKIHRFMVYRNSWVSDVNIADHTSLENFMLRAAEGLGIKTEQKERAVALAEFRDIFKSDAVQAGITALNKIESGEKLSDTEKNAIVTATGSHGAHGLDALVALAAYNRAQDAGKTSFQVNMLSEVDGVTNGPMLSHLLMGAAGNVKDLFSMLNRGGFYQGEKAQFNDWRSTAGNQDLYETTTLSTLNRLDYMVNNGDIDGQSLAPVMAFMGKLKDPVTGAILKAGRNMIKTPLTAMVYGSGIETAIKGMAGDFIANIYKQMEAAYAIRDTDPVASAKMHAETIKALIAMGMKVPANVGVSEMMDLKFSKSEEDTLLDHFMETLGKAVDVTIRDDFKHLLDIRQRFNATASLTFDIYNAAYEGLRNQLIAELVKSGDVAATIKNGVALHDLTPKQEAILDERMAKITPVLQTSMSNLSGESTAHTGMLVANKEMQPAKTLAYKNVVNFAKGFKNGTTKSLLVYGRHMVNADPGVGLGATSTHSFDAATAMTAIGMTHEVLNLHDAGGTGINDLIAHGQRMNKALWDRAISWSPTTEMFDSFMRTVKGMEALLADKDMPQEVLTVLAKSIVEQSKKSAKKNMETGRWSAPIPPQTLLMARALEAKRLAFETNSIKFAGMAEMHSIAQYAVEGGQYDVTEANRAEAIERLNKETSTITPEDIASVQAVMDALKDHVEAAMLDDKAAKDAKKTPKPEVKTSDIGTLGKPAVVSDVKLVNAFRKQPIQSVQQVAALLKSHNLTGYQDKLLTALVKSLGARASSYSVNFLSKTSTLKDVMEPANGPSHAWFVSKEGNNAIYLLSPDFKESGLTVETLLHEMTHAAVAHIIANPTAETRPLVDELERLREKAEQTVVDLGLMSKFGPAVESVQEMVAYGMTNPEFQAVLDSFFHNSENLTNKIVSGFKAFVDTLVKLLFNKEHAGLSTGFTTLALNVTGLMAAESKSVASNASINQSMAAPAINPLASLKGEEMYDALAALGTTRINSVFDAKLRETLNLMENSVHSPLSAMKATALQSAPQTPVEMWDKMKMQGLAQFAKSALASGFNFTEQEAFALEQVEATVRTALHNKDGSSTAVYRELSRLYNEVRAELKGKIADFHPNSNQAQKLYDFVFKMEQGMGNMSDYLSRFAALGLANNEFASLLGFNTKITTQPLSGMSFSEKLHALFERALEWINAKATNTFSGQKADEKLHALVNQLVDIEQRKRMKIAQSAAVAVDTFESMFRKGFDGARKGVNNIANAPFFKNHANGIIRFTGTVTSLVATDRVEQYMNGLQKFRDMTMRDRQGPMIGLVNEARGAHSMNVMYHKLLRMTKHIEGTRKELITHTTNFVTESFKDAGEYLNETTKKALAYGVLRTDIASLMDHFDIKGIHQLFESSAHLNTAIAQFEGQLAGFTHAKSYQNGAKALGLYLATNEAGAENLRLNADNIAAMFGTEHAGKVAPDVVEKAAAILDPLASLYAIRYLDSKHIEGVRAVFKEENARTDGGHGIDMMLRMHKDLQQQSKDRLFQGAGALKMKGYTPEVYNPYIRLEVADAVTVGSDGKTEGQRLEERGYAPGSQLQMDLADPTYNDSQRIYKLRDGGLVQYLTGIFSYTGQQRRGTSTHNGDLGLLSAGGLMNRAKMDKIARDQKAGIQNQESTDIAPDQQAKKRNYLVPVFNANGQVVNYRYMMNAATKDGLLERTNDFDQLLGVMAGSIYDKEKTAEQNKLGVQALYDQYKQDFAQNAGSYLQVGPNSPDKEAREVWRLLPETTREAVRDVWGTNAMMVRYDVLDMNFGYRKNSAATPFGIPEDERDNFQKAYVELLEGMLGKKAGLYVRQVEEGWQTLVREAKDTMVVKSGMTLLGNFTSNITELIWFGVPLTDIWHHHRVALKGVTAYRKDIKKLDDLQQAVRLDQLNGRDRNEVDREIVQLKDALARNPVRELVEAGMMPTIVEDVSKEDDKYSYKGKVTKAVDDMVGNLNPHVLKAGKFMMMAHDTPLYKALSYGTQVSDFVARYTLYQHVLNRAKDPVQGEKALQLVSDAFVNYDVPSHRDVQYANDMGLVYFTKYYLRIQKVIALLYRDNPGRAMMLLTLGHFLDFIPMLTHSAALQRIGNPFSIGAFEALSSLDELLTVKTLMYPFR